MEATVYKYLMEKWYIINYDLLFVSENNIYCFYLHTFQIHVRPPGQ